MIYNIIDIFLNARPDIPCKHDMLALVVSDLELVKLHLKYNADPFANGNRAFMIAVELNQMAVIELFLNDCEPPENIASLGLIRATTLEMVDFFLGKGAQFEEKEFAAFRAACEKGHLAIARKLHQTTVSKTAEKDALLRACAFGHLDIVHYLVEESKVVIDDNALRTASQYGQLHIVECLIKKYKIPANDKILLAASVRRHAKIVEVLLDNFQPTPTGIKDCVKHVCQKGGSAVLQEFLKKSLIDQELKNHSFGLAWENDNADIVELLLENGVDLNVLDREIHPFTDACNNNALALISCLLPKIELSVELQKKGVNMAISFGHIDTVKLLFQHEKTLSTISEYFMNDWLPLSIAAKEGHTAIIEFLLPLSKTNNVEALNVALKHKHAKAAKLIFQDLFNSHKNYKGMIKKLKTLWSVACETKDFEVLKSFFPGTRQALIHELFQGRYLKNESLKQNMYALLVNKEISNPDDRQFVIDLLPKSSSAHKFMLFQAITTLDPDSKRKIFHNVFELDLKAAVDETAKKDAEGSTNQPSL